MSNGCGCSKGMFKYIKPPYARKFYVACCMHDDDYERGGGKVERFCSDRNLYYRMLAIIERENLKQPWKITWMTVVAYAYYVSVRLFGWHYFNYKQ